MEPYAKGNELKHYGVLGMKWGVRRDRKNTSSPKSKGKDSTAKEKKPKAKNFTGMTIDRHQKVIDDIKTKK